MKDGKKVKPGELRKLRDDMLSDRTILMSKCPLYVEILDDIVKSESISVSEDGKYSYKEADTKLVYKVCLRNIDLLEQISYRLQRKRPDKSSDNIQLLKKMFDNLAEIIISTYQNDKGIQADIKYRFFDAIKRFLEELSKEGNERYQGVFNSIYADSRVSIFHFLRPNQ